MKSSGVDEGLALLRELRALNEGAYLDVLDVAERELRQVRSARGEYLILRDTKKGA